MYIFTPMTEEQISSSGSILEPGIYDFKIDKSTRKMSKNGNPMAELQLSIWDNDGQLRFIYDYLVFSSVPLNIKKIKHFCESVGLTKQYITGCLPEDMINQCSGRVDVGIQGESVNPNGGFYPKKNVVIDYLPKQEKDENIPF